MFLLWRHMNESGENYYRGDTDQRWADPDANEERDAYVKKLVARCNEEEVYQDGAPFPKRFFLDIVEIAMEKFSVGKKN